MFPDKVRLVYHHFPDTESNVSMALAESLEFAGEQDMFWEMHDKLIERVPQNFEELAVIAEEAGLDIDNLYESIENGKYTDNVIDAIGEAKNHKVESISLFVNSTEYRHYPGKLDDLVIMINRELSKDIKG